MLSQIYPGSYQGSMKDFYNRGGFVNGLNPTIVGDIWYVNGEGATYTGLNGHEGRSPQDGLATIAYAFTKLRNYDILVLDGVFREQCVAPQDVFDVTIIGAGNRPRQATDSGVATGGGASWLAPSSPTASTPLLKLREQAWTLINFQMAPVASSACVRIARSETAVEADGSHATFLGMYMVGGGSGGSGIEDYGGGSHVLVDHCEFQLLTGSAIGYAVNSGGIATPYGWVIRNNKFMQNTNDIKMSHSYAVIRENQFMTAGSGSTNKVISTNAATGGGNNQVLLNQFSNTEAQIAPGSGYTGVSTDTWMNYVNDQAALAYGQPA